VAGGIPQKERAEGEGGGVEGRAKRREEGGQGEGKRRSGQGVERGKGGGTLTHMCVGLRPLATWASRRHFGEGGIDWQCHKVVGMGIEETFWRGWYRPAASQGGWWHP